MNRRTFLVCLSGGLVCHQLPAVYADEIPAILFHRLIMNIRALRGAVLTKASKAEPQRRIIAGLTEYWNWMDRRPEHEMADMAFRALRIWHVYEANERKISLRLLTRMLGNSPMCGMLARNFVHAYT